MTRITAEFLVHTNSDALYGKPGLDCLLVETPYCRAVIAKQGAQVLEFQARDRAALLWMSPKAEIAAGKPVRGGIPLCLPWFGVNRKDPAKPKHGLVRTALWQLNDARQLSSGEVELQFQYRHPGDALFGIAFNCQLNIRMGESLTLELEVENCGNSAAEFSWALHSYFAVEDVHTVSVTGLEGCEYLDNTRKLERFTQREVVTFSGEVDRVFENASAEQTIICKDPIKTRSENCHSVIVWNPGEALAASLPDIGEHYVEYVCVEHGNAFANSWQLQPGEFGRATLELTR